MHRSLYAILIICAIAGPAVGQPNAPAAQQQGAPPAIAVGTVAAERKLISKTLDFVGRVEAINRVQINARVKGYLEDVLFKEGDTVKEGDALYRIEHGLFQADVEQAQGALERSQAAKTLAEVQLQRAEQLAKSQSGTQVARDQALAADQQAAGAILTDQASLDTAKINLGYTDIRSPIGGRIGRTSVTKGNVVGPESGALTLIVSQDPMYVTFPVSQRDLLAVQKAGGAAGIKDIKIRIRFSDGSTYDQVGTINFVDVTVDKTTDTVTARAAMPNPNGVLIDGQLVRVGLEAGTPEEKVVVPQSALIADQEGVYIFIVEGGRAVVRRIKAGGESGVGMIVDQGLSGGELVIVEGLQSIRPGVPVQASPLPEVVGRN
jgi:membrane fusion protein, multidrug efflux system